MTTRGAIDGAAGAPDLRHRESGARAVEARFARPGGVARERELRAYLVEDNLYVRENLIAALQELAPVHVVDSAADESVAADWLRAADDAGGEPACDVVIIDVFLHSGSGLGVLAAARRSCPTATRIVLTNYATDDMRARCLASGADRVFDKSRDIDLLVSYCTALADLKASTPH